MSTADSHPVAMARQRWASVATAVRRLQFTFTFQVTLALVISFLIGNTVLYQAAAKRLYEQQENLFRGRVLYLSNVILSWEKSVRDTMEFATLNPSVRSLDPKQLAEVLTPLFEQTSLRRWKVWRADGTLLLSSTPVTNVRLNEKRNRQNRGFQKALNGDFNYGVNSVLAGARLAGCLEASMPIKKDSTTNDHQPPASRQHTIGVLTFCLPFSKIGDDSGLIKADQISQSETNHHRGSHQNQQDDDNLIEINRGRTKGQIFFMISPTGHLVFPTVRNDRFDHVSLLSPKRIVLSSWYPFVKAALEPQGVDQFRKVDIEGNTYFMYTHQISKQWRAVSVVDTDTIYAPLRRNLSQLMLVQALSLLVTSVAIYFVCRQLTKPLKAVVQTVSDLSDLRIPAAQPTSLSSSSIVEVRQVSQAIHRLSFAMDSFGRYLPKEVVRTVLDSNQSARLGGNVKDLVIMFTDIKDFTSYSETMEASSLLSHLNEYLTELTDAILGTSGTIDKYIGDSIMAFWGAPAPVEAPASKACAASLAIREATHHVNEQWQKAGLSLRFDTRIGINLGPVIVGNVGSEERFNYTVIGDSVNLASRLESTNKLYGTDILVSRSIVNAANQETDNHYLFRLLDRVKVKGKQESSDIYALLGPRARYTNEQITDLETANELMARALDFGAEEGLRLLNCLPESDRQRPSLQDLKHLLHSRLTMDATDPDLS